MFSITYRDFPLCLMPCKIMVMETAMITGRRRRGVMMPLGWFYWLLLTDVYTLNPVHA